MRNVADSTGGRPMVNRNMEQAIPDLIEDNSSFYLLGYYPDPFVRDGQFHDVNVSVTRPGLRVRSRVGYTGAEDGQDLHRRSQAVARGRARRRAASQRPHPPGVRGAGRRDGARHDDRRHARGHVSDAARRRED